MLNRHFATSRPSVPQMVATLTLVGLGAVWLLTRTRPAGGLEVPKATEPPWASVAGEEDPGAAVEPPPGGGA